MPIFRGFRHDSPYSGVAESIRSAGKGAFSGPTLPFSPISGNGGTRFAATRRTDTWKGCERTVFSGFFRDFRVSRTGTEADDFLILFNRTKIRPGILSRECIFGEFSLFSVDAVGGPRILQLPFFSELISQQE